MFDGTVISKGDASFDDVVDVEADETGTYGPAQYPKKHCHQNFKIGSF